MLRAGYWDITEQNRLPVYQYLVTYLNNFRLRISDALAMKHHLKIVHLKMEITALMVKGQELFAWMKKVTFDLTFRTEGIIPRCTVLFKFFGGGFL
jgi:hypothetical protein